MHDSKSRRSKYLFVLLMGLMASPARAAGTPRLSAGSGPSGRIVHVFAAGQRIDGVTFAGKTVAVRTVGAEAVFTVPYDLDPREYKVLVVLESVPQGVE